MSEVRDDVAHGVTSLRHVFRERRLSVASMDRPLRVATGMALASVVAVVVLIALRDVHAPDVVLGHSEGGVLVKMATPLFVATLVLLSVGFAYLISGAVLASWPVTLVSLTLITGAIAVEAGAFGRLFGVDGFTSLLPGWARWTTRGLLAAVWLVAGAAWWLRLRRPERQLGSPVRLAMLAMYALIFGGYFTVLWAAAPTSGTLDLFPEVVGLVMLDVVLLVYPVLTVAAVDFGEWGGLLGERLVGSFAGRRAPQVLPAAVALSASLGCYGYANLTDGHGQLSAHRLWWAVRAVLIVAVALVLLVSAGRALGVHRRSWPTALNFAVIFAAVALGQYVVGPVTALFVHQPKAEHVAEVGADGRFGASADVLRTTGGQGAGGYTLLIPRGWVHAGLSGVESWTDYAVPGAVPGQAHPPSARVVVATLPATVPAQLVATAGKLGPVGEQERDGPWTRIEFREDAHTTGLVWTRPNPAAGHSSFVIEVFATRVPLADVRPELEAVAHSFRARSETPAVLPKADDESPADAVQSYEDRLTSLSTAITAGVLACLVAGLVLAGRRWPQLAVASVLVLGITTVATILYFADSFGRTLYGAHTHWPYVSRNGMLTALGVLGVAAVVALRRSPRRRTVLTGIIALDTTAWALVGMDALYDHALRASRVSVWAAVTVLVAIAWDVTMSGESLTNNDSRHFPRATRLLAFLGYVLLLAATVLFYTAQRGAVNGQPTEALFEPEAVTQNGLFRVALPVAVLLLLLRFGRAHAATTARADTTRRAALTNAGSTPP